MSARCALILALLVSPPMVGHVRASATDSFQMELMDSLPFFVLDRFACGDANHNGIPEVYVWQNNGPNYAVEWQHGVGFQAYPLGCSSGYLWAVGDPDRDGLADLVSQRGQSLIRVHESPTDTSLPTALVWWDTLSSSGAMTAAIADLDCDSSREILLRLDSKVAIFENQGNNAYEWTGTVRLGRSRGIVVTHDLDLDGRPEVLNATSSSGHYVATLHEAVGNDTFREVARCSLSMVPYPFVKAVGAAADMDRDGRAEGIALGVAQDGACDLAVIEAVSDDSFRVVWETTFNGSYASQVFIAVGDVDGDSVPEFALSGDGLRLFRCVGPDLYEQFWAGPRCGPEIGMYDLNRDGKGELICRTQLSQTVIYEYFSLGLEELERRRLEQMAVEPTVVARGRAVQVRVTSGEWRVVDEVEVLDVAGRRTATLAVGRTGCATWQTRGVAPGAYFVRVSSGSLSVARKVIVSSSQQTAFSSLWGLGHNPAPQVTRRVVVAN